MLSPRTSKIHLWGPSWKDGSLAGNAGRPLCSGFAPCRRPREIAIDHNFGSGSFSRVIVLDFNVGRSLLMTCAILIVYKLVVVRRSYIIDTIC